MAERLLYAAEVAEVLGVSEAKAHELMQTMRCVNMSRNPASLRPRWATTASEIERWQKARLEVPQERNVAMIKPPKTRRQEAPKGCDVYYFDENGHIKRQKAIRA